MKSRRQIAAASVLAVLAMAGTAFADELVITFRSGTQNIGGGNQTAVWTNRTTGSDTKIDWINGSTAVMPEGVGALTLQNWDNLPCSGWVNEGTGVVHNHHGGGSSHINNQ